MGGRFIPQVLFVLFGIYRVSLQQSCPTAIEIFPCVCESDNFDYLDLDCSAVSDESELASVFDNSDGFPKPDFRKLTINHQGLPSDLVVLKATTFGIATFEMVDITRTYLQTFEGDVFQNSKATLWYLNLQKNAIENFPFATIGEYSKLWQLDLAYNGITNAAKYDSQSLWYINFSHNPGMILEPGVFSGLPNLEDVYLDAIELSVLQSGILSGNFTKLSVVSLNDNKLDVLMHNAIASSANTLEAVFINNNELSSIEVKAISGMKIDGFITLQQNSLENIERAVWQPILDEISPNGFVDFSGNGISCGCDIAWLVVNQSHMNAISDDTTCYGGINIHDLPAEVFQTKCDEP